MKCKKCGKEYEANFCSNCGFNEKHNNMINKLAKYSAIFLGVIFTVLIIVIIDGIVNKPKPDYDKFNVAIESYISTIDNITDIRFVDEGMYSIAVDDSWFNTTEINKIKFCDNVRNTFTGYAWDYNIISENKLIWVAFNDKEGIRLAEPNGSIGEYRILY